MINIKKRFRTITWIAFYLINFTILAWLILRNFETCSSNLDTTAPRPAICFSGGQYYNYDFYIRFFGGAYLILLVSALVYSSVSVSLFVIKRYKITDLKRRRITMALLFLDVLLSAFIIDVFKRDQYIASIHGYYTSTLMSLEHLAFTYCIPLLVVSVASTLVFSLKHLGPEK